MVMPPWLTPATSLLPDLGQSTTLYPLGTARRRGRSGLLVRHIAVRVRTSIARSTMKSQTVSDLLLMD